MRRYRGSNLKIDWRDEELLNDMTAVLDEATDRVADVVLADAKRRAPKDTGKLASEIEIKKSKYPGGGRVVAAQGPGNYTKFYASFVELGHYSSMYGRFNRKSSKSGRTYVPAQPFLRPAIKKARRILRKYVQEGIDNA